jgi:hypothetical protein
VSIWQILTMKDEKNKRKKLVTVLCYLKKIILEQLLRKLRESKKAKYNV